MLGFYQGLLGCTLERELPDLGLIQLRAGASLIDIVPVDSELGRLGGKAPSQDGRNLEHFCLKVEVDEANLLQYLSEHGIECGDAELRYGAAGFSKSVYISDPEGNVVELKTPADGKPDRKGVAR